jgi:hypothetical protein
MSHANGEQAENEQGKNKQIKCDITKLCMVRLKITSLFRALTHVVLNDKYRKHTQAIHGNMEQLDCEWKIIVPYTKLWHPSCKHYFAIAQISYVLVQNSFQFFASSCCTCSVSHWSTFCSMHQGDTTIAVLRRGAFKGITSER